jgi:hypothetical protein
MRKILSLLTIALLVGFASCDKLNEKPVFSDGNAFVAFNNTALSVNETTATLTIPVTLASVSGISTTVEYTVIDGTAVQGENFELVDVTGTLTFDATNRTQNIVVNVTNKPGVFTGDLRFTIQLSDAGTVKPNAENICTVTIVDLDHPLAAILGNWNATGTSYFNGSETWVMSFAKDAKDVSVVWISNFVKGGSGVAVYGVVNAEKTQIRIPINQVIATSPTYLMIRLEGYYGPTGDVSIPAGGYITAVIAADNSTITIQDEIGSHVYNDAAATSSAGWYNIFQSNTLLTR